MKFPLKLFLCLFLISLILNFPIYADNTTPATQDEKIKTLEEQIKELQEKNEKLMQMLQDIKDDLKDKEAKKLENIEDVTTQTTTQTPENIMNPKISAIGTFLWHINHNKTIDPGAPFQAKEIELAIESNIDPFSRANIYLGIEPGTEGNHTHVHAEEAYVTFYKLPFDLQAKGGIFKSDITKVNTQHKHDQPWTDTPMMLENYFGEEGLNGTGVSFSKIFGLGDIYTELTGQIYNDENAIAYSGGLSKIPLVGGKFRAYADISDESNLDMGISCLSGYYDADNTRKQNFFSGELTYRFTPKLLGKYRNIIFRNEYLWSLRDNYLVGDNDILNKGAYSYLGYRLNKDWILGARYDWSESPFTADDLSSKAYSLILTYWPSEFLSHRLQYKKTIGVDGQPTDGIFYQLIFNIGPHGAHQF